MSSVVYFEARQCFPKIFPAKGLIIIGNVNGGMLLLTGFVTGVLLGLTLSKILHFSALYACIPGGLSILFISDLCLACIFYYQSIKKKKSSEDQTKNSIQQSTHENIKDIIQNIEIQDPKVFSEDQRDSDFNMAKYEEYLAQLRAINPLPKKSIDMVKEYKQVAEIVMQKKTPKKLIEELHKKQLHGFVHRSEWEGRDRELISNLKTGIQMMHQVFTKIDIKVIVEALEDSSYPCFHGTAVILQNLLVQKDNDLLECMVNLDPNHSPLQRATEFVRVYKTQKMREHLEKAGKAICKEFLDKLSNDENFNQTYMKVELIVEWCEKNDLLNQKNASVKLNQWSTTSMSIHNTPALIAEVLGYL